MSKIIPVKTNGTVSYEIVLTQGWEELLLQLKKLGYRSDQKVCIVTDATVAKLYSDETMHVLQSYFEKVMLHIFPAGEENKNLETVSKLYEDLILNHFDRRDFLIALGGGVVGDLTGFAAATYLRGIDFIQAPTTLLAQVDSSIGGKTGVDFLQYKNMVGAFNQPKLVYMNLNVLKSLPEMQIISGMGEVLKHGLIKDSVYFSWLREKRESIESLDLTVMEELIYRSCNIKREVVERDPKEKGERALLNFGHTIGHAIEKLSDFSLSHGECVALGMIAASYLSCRMGYISKQEFEMIFDTIQTFGFRTKVSDFLPQEVLKATKSDKKMNGAKVKFILLESVGNACMNQDLTDEQILDGIQFLLS